MCFSFSLCFFYVTFKTLSLNHHGLVQGTLGPLRVSEHGRMCEPLITIECWSKHGTLDSCYHIHLSGNFRSKKFFSRSPSTTKIKLTKYFLPCINGISLYCRVVIATKIKPGKNLADELFYRRKIPNLLYMYLYYKWNMP